LKLNFSISLIEQFNLIGDPECVKNNLKYKDLDSKCHKLMELLKELKENENEEKDKLVSKISKYKDKINELNLIIEEKNKEITNINEKNINNSSSLYEANEKMLHEIFNLKSKISHIELILISEKEKIHIINNQIQNFLETRILQNNKHLDQSLESRIKEYLIKNKAKTSDNEFHKDKEDSVDLNGIINHLIEFIISYDECKNKIIEEKERLLLNLKDNDSNIHTELSSIKSEHKLLGEKLIAKNEEIESIIKVSNNLKIKINEQEIKLNENSQIISNLQSSTNTLNKDILELKNLNLYKENIIDELQQKIDKNESKNQELILSYSNLENEYKELFEKYNSLVNRDNSSNSTNSKELLSENNNSNNTQTNNKKDEGLSKKNVGFFQSMLAGVFLTEKDASKIVKN